MIFSLLKDSIIYNKSTLEITLKVYAPFDNNTLKTIRIRNL